MIEYPKRGEIYLVNLPSKPGDTKNRPAIVILSGNRKGKVYFLWKSPVYWENYKHIRIIMQWEREQK